MSDPGHGLDSALEPLDEPGDAELISSVRAGDLEAYGLLFERHADAARRLARQLVSPADADDLVSEAFAKVLGVLQRGGGPDLAFRAYLLTSLRRLHIDKIRAESRLRPTDDLTPYDPGVPFEDTAIAGFENQAAAKAFAELPERWQQVLWHTEVEGQRPAEVAPLLGMSPNSVSALAYRAREGLRQAFVSMHAQDAVDDACATTRANLGAYIRNGVSRRDADRIETHLQSCRPCSAIYLELMEINSDLGALLAPLFLGAAGAGYLATTGVAQGGLVALLAQGKDWLLQNPAGRAVAVSSAAGVAVAGVALGLVATSDDGEPPAASPSPSSSVPASAPPGDSGPPDSGPPDSGPDASPRPPAPPPDRAAPPPAPADTPPADTPPADTPPADTPPENQPQNQPQNQPSDQPPTDQPPTDQPPANSAPVIEQDVVTVAAAAPGEPVTVDVTAGATDPDGDPITVRSARVARPSHGSVELGGASARQIAQPGVVGRAAPGWATARPSGVTTLTYTSGDSWRGTDTVVYVLTDPQGNTATGRLRVRTPNAEPHAEQAEVQVPAWRAHQHDVRLDLTDRVGDVNRDRLRISSVTQPSTGRARITGRTEVTYTAPPGIGRYPVDFDYTVVDGHGGSDSATVTVRRTPDRAPVARDDTASAEFEGEASVDVLANDSDEVQHLLTVTGTTEPAHGSARVVGDRVVYVPDRGFSGTDRFSYTVEDVHGATATAEVGVEVEEPLLTLEAEYTPYPTYEHLRYSVDGLPAGRTATFELEVDSVTGGHPPAGLAGEACDPPPAEGGGPTTLSCEATVTGDGTDDLEVLHVDVEVEDGWDYDTDVRTTLTLDPVD